eukprot:2232700-Rhodomonas_salina.2
MGAREGGREDGDSDSIEPDTNRPDTPHDSDKGVADRIAVQPSSLPCTAEPHRIADITQDGSTL